MNTIQEYTVLGNKTDLKDLEVQYVHTCAHYSCLMYTGYETLKWGLKWSKQKIKKFDVLKKRFCRTVDIIKKYI